MNARHCVLNFFLLVLCGIPLPLQAGSGVGCAAEAGVSAHSGYVSSRLQTVPGTSRVPREGSRGHAPFYGYRVVNVYPHDPEAFTQGLLYVDGALYESTGLEGRSTLRRVKLETGEVLKSLSLAPVHFGEGLTHWGERLIQLTWRSRLGFVYDRADFKLLDQFHVRGEGWGITQDGTRLILSDGTDRLQFLDPVSFAPMGTLRVHDRGTPIRNLNELEFVKGEIFANIWQQDLVARISPRTGEVTGWLDLGPLRNLLGHEASAAECLNGIAHDSEKDRLFVTGKFWPKLFEIELQSRPLPAHAAP